MVGTSPSAPTMRRPVARSAARARGGASTGRTCRGIARLPAQRHLLQEGDLPWPSTSWRSPAPDDTNNHKHSHLLSAARLSAHDSITNSRPLHGRVVSIGRGRDRIRRCPGWCCHRPNAPFLRLLPTCCVRQTSTWSRSEPRAYYITQIQAVVQYKPKCFVFSSNVWLPSPL